MKKNDLYFIVFVLAIFLPFFLIPELFTFYDSFNKEHGFITSFIKFAVLATIGESIGLRVRKGVYNEKGFGLIPRAIVWGFLGLTIKLAFIIFYSGTPLFLQSLGIDMANVMNGALSIKKVVGAFAISVLMNTIYAPVMMTLHKITDTHIIATGGTINGLFKPIRFGKILAELNWNVQWNFVFKKTIPFFWFPAHTITFLLPTDYQVLFAALLGIALGLILAIASLKGN